MGLGIKRLFKKIGSFDLFAANTPSLNLKGQSKLSTCSGILFSIGMWLFVLAMLVFLSRSLTDRSSPSFYNFEEPTTVSDTNTYLFSSKGFQMGFGMINTASQLPYMNSSIFSIQAYLHVGPSVTGDKYWEDRLLDIEPCTAAHFDGNFSQYQDLWCIKEEQSFGNVFVKSYDDAWFEIRFLPCQPGMTPGVECAPDDEINSTLQASTWIAWYPEYMINPLVYNNPMSQDYTSIPRPVTLDVEKQVLMSVKVIDFNSDNGVLVSSPDVSKVLTIKEVDDGTETQSGTKAFLTASIVNSGIIFHYNRTYTKLGDILGQIFGLAGLIMPLLGLVLLPWSSSKIYQHMINQVYEVRDDGLDKSGKKGRPRKRSQRSSQRNGRQDNKAKKRVENRPQIYVKSPSNGDYMKYGYNEEFGGNGVIHQQMDQDQLNGLGITMTVSADIEKQHLSDPLLNEMSREDYRGDNYLNSPIVIDPKSRSLGSDNFKNSQERKASNFLTKSILSKLIPKETHEESFQLTFGQWVKSLFKSHPKSNIFNKGKESLLEQIDVLTIIRKLNEIDNLKACLLSRDQRVLFDNLPKPILELNDDEAAPNGVVRRRGYAQSYRGEQTQAWDVYSRIKRSEERSEVDQKLLSIFERKEELY